MCEGDGTETKTFPRSIFPWETRRPFSAKQMEREREERGKLSMPENKRESFSAEKEEGKMPRLFSDGRGKGVDRFLVSATTISILILQ